jgi:NAD(P)-dependent dehydrogenase (short-subunit alcohol dehydrogenase family)
MCTMEVIVITGGSRGIGAAAARACADRGLGVMLTYNSHAEAAEALVAQIGESGGRAVALPLDVADTANFPDFGKAVTRTLEEKWNGVSLHGLVNNAGFGLYNHIETVTEAQFDGLFSVHLKGPLFLAQALLPLIREGGATVNLTSATTRVATAGVAPHASFKGGLEVLTRYMAKEFGPRRIRANAVSPGAIRTELGGGLTDEFEALLASQAALGRVGEAEEVGRVIASLLTDDLGWVNGQSIEVGGGYRI